MTEDEIKFNAQAIARMLHDDANYWFHFKWIQILGFDKCYQLASLAVMLSHENKIFTSPAKFYNGCVHKELLKGVKNYE